MQVTFTNTTTSPIYLSAIYMTLQPTGQPGAAVTTRRTRAQLDAEQQLKQYVQAGSITLLFATETGDNAKLGASGPALTSYSNGTRPAANTIPTFTSIWNTDDNSENWSDGVNWRDNNGVIT